MIFLKIGLAVYLVFIPFLLFALGVIVLKNRQFLKEIRLVSWLGESKKPDHRLVNFLFSLFGFLNFFLAWGVAKVLPDHFLSQIGFLFLFLTSLASFLVGFFPRDKAREAHGILGTLLSVAMVGAVLFLIYPIYISPLIPNLLIIFNFLIIFFTSLYLLLTGLRNFGLIKKKRLIVRTSYYQWAMFLLSMIWNFLMAFFILRALVNG